MGSKDERVSLKKVTPVSRQTSSTKNIYYCVRCESKRGVCPRGGCESVIIAEATITTTTSITPLTKKEMLEKNLKEGAWGFEKYLLKLFKP